MVRCVIPLVLTLSACSTSAQSSTPSDAAALTLAAEEARYCPAIVGCNTTTGSIPFAETCITVADAGNSTLCGLVLTGFQAGLVAQVGIATSGSQICGAEEAENHGHTGALQPPCEALLACSKAQHDGSLAAASSCVAEFDYDGPCRSSLAYMKSLGQCPSVAFDAGQWQGLPPPAAAGGGDDVSASGSASVAKP